MPTRRDFLQRSAAVTGGIAFVGCDMLDSSPAQAQSRRREVAVNGKRIKTVDVHSHCVVPEALALMGLRMNNPSLRPDLDVANALDVRLKAMDDQGIDVEALSINPTWYKIADRDQAAKVIEVQNEKLAEFCGKHSDRFVAFATVALQFPDLAAEQLEQGVKKYGLRGASIGGNVAGTELSDPKLNPFWAKAEELGALVFMHPQADGASAHLGPRLKGNGYLSNVVGYPVETAIAISHLIFEGTLDRYPGLKFCAAHSGGYLPSYAHRMDHGCQTRPAECPGGPHGAIKKTPSDYLKQLYYDTMVFSPEGIRHLVAQVGASQLMIGTDFPFPWTTTAIDEVMAAPLNDADKEAILGGNAAKLLGIKG